MRRALPMMLLAGLAIVACSCADRKNEVTGSTGGDHDAHSPRIASDDAWGPHPAPVGREAPGSREDDFLAAAHARDATRPVLLSALRGGTPDERARAAWALARIGGPDAVAPLTTVLDGTSELGDAFAALGLLEPPRTSPGEPPEPEGDWAALEDALWTRHAIAEDAHEQNSLLFSIARLGGGRSVARLAIELEGGGTPDRNAARMEALGILCARGFALDSHAVEVLIGQLEADDEPIVSASASYAWSRCAAPSAELLGTSDERQRLVAGLQTQLEHGSAAAAWKALGALGEVPDAVPDAILGPDPGAMHWTEEVEAIRALGRSTIGTRTVVARLGKASLAGFVGARRHALLEALRSARNAPEVDAITLAALNDQIEADSVQEESDRGRFLALVGCEIEVLAAIRTQSVAPLCQGIEGLPPGYASAAGVDALLRLGRVPATGTGLGTTQGEEVSAPELAARDAALLERAHTETAALSALAEVSAPQAKQILRRALERNEPSIVAAAAAAVAARSPDAAKRDVTAVPMLARLVQTLPNPSAVEARIAAIEALGALARGSEGTAPTGAIAPQGATAPWLEEVVLPLADDPSVAIRRTAREALLGNPALVDRFDRRVRPQSSSFEARADPLVELEGVRGLRMETDAGDFDVSFAGTHAPHNQANLVRLARAGYFEGIIFHRVVPGFVVQGGDPGGDGYGGPGHLVPCEWSNLRYVRGAVGMALAGKDTGGSQFFVTHTPQPHLDGRYTLFGHVTEGMDVVDRLLPGTVITRVTVLEE